MRYLVFLLFVLMLGRAYASSALDNYIKNFSYEDRKDMKMHSKTLIAMMKKKRVVLVDIRFPEEYQTWRLEESINLPLNKLSENIGLLKKEIKKDKIIVTACPYMTERLSQ